MIMTSVQRLALIFFLKKTLKGWIVVLSSSLLTRTIFEESLKDDKVIDLWNKDFEVVMFEQE